MPYLLHAMQQNRAFHICTEVQRYIMMAFIRLVGGENIRDPSEYTHLSITLIKAHRQAR